MDQPWPWGWIFCSATWHPVEVADVHQPHPRNVAILSDAGGAVPLGLLPQGIGLFQVTAGQSLVHVLVNGVVGVGRVLGGAGVLGRIVDVIQLHGGMGAPAPHQRGGEGPVVGGVPAHALDGTLDAQLRQLVGQVGGQCLTDRVAVGVKDVQLSLDAVLFPHAVAAHDPAGIVQKLGRALGVILYFRSRVIPGQLIADAVGRGAVAVEDVVDHLLTVDADIDGTAHRHIGGHRIAGGHTVGVHRGLGDRQVDAPVIHRLVGGEGVAGDGLVGVGGRGVGHVHLPCLSGQESGVLLHKEDGDLFHLGLFAVVVGVGLQNDLLAPVPLLEDIPARTDGVGAVGGAVVGVLGHDADDGHGVGPDGEGFCHVENHSGVVHRLGVVQHGEVVDRAGCLDGVVGEGHILGSQGFTVGELHIIPDGDRPGQAVLAGLAGGGQVIADGQVGIGHREGALDQRLMDVLSRAPAEGRVKARFRLGIGVHGNDDRVPVSRLLGGGWGLARGLPAAACQQSRRHDGSQHQ